MSDSDDGASRLSRMLDGVTGATTSSPWADDEPAPPEPVDDDDWSVDDAPAHDADHSDAPESEAAEPEAAEPDEPAPVAAVHDEPEPVALDATTSDDQAPDPTGRQRSAKRLRSARRHHGAATDDGGDVFDVHDIEVPDHEEQAIPTGETGFVLPTIVQATSDGPPSNDDDADDAAGPPTGPTLPLASTSPQVSIAPTVTPASVPPAVPLAATAAAPLADPSASGWNEHVPARVTGSNRAPTRRPRVRRVTRVVRHIDPWSTFKLALLFSLVAYLTILTSGVLLWRVADTTGALANVERWFTQFGWETFEFKGGEIFHNAWIIGLFGAVFTTGGAVLLVTLFNLVSDIIGGIRVSVLEEEVIERTVSSNRRYVVRRPGAVDAAAATAATPWSLDDEGGGATPPPQPVDPRADAGTAAATGNDDWSVDEPAPHPTG